MIKINLSRDIDPSRQGMNRRNADQTIEAMGDSVTEWVDRFIDDVTPEQTQEGNDKAIEAALLLALMANGRFAFQNNINAAMNSGLMDAESQIKSQLKDLPMGVEAGSISVNEEFTRHKERLLAGLKSSVNAIVITYSQRISALIGRLLAAGIPVSEIKIEVEYLINKMLNEIKRAVHTTINQSAAESKMIASTIVASILGLQALVKHKSALTATTRSSHAARHGKIYTVDQQRRWWASGANAINCLCSVDAVVEIK